MPANRKMQSGTLAQSICGRRSESSVSMHSGRSVGSKLQRRVPIEEWTEDVPVKSNYKGDMRLGHLQASEPFPDEVI